MKKITKQNQIQEFLDNLTDEEFSLIETCYDCLFWDFDKMYEFGLKSKEPEVKAGLPLVKRLADFERRFKVRVYELLDIPGSLYEGHTIPMCESVLLPVGKEPNGETIDVRLGMREQFALHVRDSFYAGSWERMKKEITTNKIPEQIQYLPSIDNLRKYEERHKVNLGVLMREWVPLEPENEENNNYKGLNKSEGGHDYGKPNIRL